MWPWLQKNLSKKAILLSKLASFTTGMHVLVFLCSVVIYHLRSETKLVINSAQRLHNRGATVVVLPFQKQVKQAMATIKEKTMSHSLPKKQRAPTTLVQTKPKPKPKSVPQKKIVPKKVASTVAKAKADTMAGKKKTVVKTPTKKVTQVKKTVAKKSTSTKSVPIKKTELPALKMAKAYVEQPDKSVVYIGRHDAQLLKVHEQIVEEIHKHWCPPVGIARDCVCELKVLVNGAGSVTKVNIEKPSGVLVYDISARSAVLAMSIPKWGWGKELMIAFNQ